MKYPPCIPIHVRLHKTVERKFPLGPRMDSGPSLTILWERPVSPAKPPKHVVLIHRVFFLREGPAPQKYLTNTTSVGPYLLMDGVFSRLKTAQKRTQNSTTKSQQKKKKSRIDLGCLRSSNIENFCSIKTVTLQEEERAAETYARQCSVKTRQMSHTCRFAKCS